MKVKIKIYEEGGVCEREIEVNSGKIEEVVSYLSIDEEELSYYKILINGQKKSLRHKLSEGDEVVIFPIVGGG